MLETTVCYLRKDNQVLMLYRNKKKADINAGKWIGIGGKIECGETPEQANRREFYEETGLTLVSTRRRGTVHFIGEQWEEYMYVFEATDAFGELSDCSEGELRWIDQNNINDLPMWEGDHTFLDILLRSSQLFELKLVYHQDRCEVINLKEELSCNIGN